VVALMPLQIIQEFLNTFVFGFPALNTKEALVNLDKVHETYSPRGDFTEKIRLRKNAM
jgi:hypothetical protein